MPPIEPPNCIRTHSPVDYRRRLLLAATVASSLPFGVVAAGKDTTTWPDKPVKIIVPFAPGGGNDMIARFIGTKLSIALERPFIIENKPGAGGNLGTEQGLRAQPDGYTLILVASSYSVNPAVHKLSFDPVADVTPIVQIAGGPMIIVASANGKVRSIADLIRQAKASPGQVTYASSGVGGISHGAIALLARQAGIELLHVPYKGNAPALTDTIAGTTDIVCSSIAGAMPLIKSKRLIAIAVTTQERHRELPNVPTVSESGVIGYDVAHWYGLIGPHGLSSIVVAKINATVNEVLRQADVAEYLQRDGIRAVGGTPSDLGKRIHVEIERWRQLAATGDFSTS